jgi:predicted amidohydrolase YtcJ
MLRRAARTLAGLLCLVSSSSMAGEPTLILHSGRVHTLETEGMVFEALAIEGARVAAVGSTEEILGLAGGTTRVVDLSGRTVLPGLVDGHCHLLGLGQFLQRLDLVGTRSYQEVLDRVRAEVARREPGEWIEGRGWDQNDWADPGFPHHEPLSRISPENPVYLRRVDGHAALVNQAALDRAGIDGETPDPPGGRILRSEGRPTGVLLDEAVDRITEVMPPPGAERNREALLLAQERCLAAGLTGVHEMGITREELEVYRALERGGDLELRVYLAASEEGELARELVRSGPVPETEGGRLTLRAVKFYMDGALGSRGAALLEPYSDDPGNRGMLLQDLEEFARRIETVHRAGLQICTHAIGDRANREVMDAYERLLERYPSEDPRHRIEHAQVLAPEEVPRFARLGVIPSMQFTHCTSDMPWAPARLGPERISGAYAWRDLLESGAWIVGGSDFPVESYDPLTGIYAAVTRKAREGGPDGGWSPEQCLTRFEAVRSYTVNPARASFREGELGTLAPGMLADLVILDRDLLEIPAREIPSVEVVATVVAGRFVHGGPPLGAGERGQK